MIRVTVAVAVPAPLAGLAARLRDLGFAPENAVSADAIATMTLLAEDEAAACAIVATAERWFALDGRGAKLVPQPFTPLGDERPAADRVE